MLLFYYFKRLFVEADKFRSDRICSWKFNKPFGITNTPARESMMIFNKVRRIFYLCSNFFPIKFFVYSFSASLWPWSMPCFVLSTFSLHNIGSGLSEKSLQCGVNPRNGISKTLGWSALELLHLFPDLDSFDFIAFADFLSLEESVLFTCSVFDNL